MQGNNERFCLCVFCFNLAQKSLPSKLKPIQACTEILQSESLFTFSSKDRPPGSDERSGAGLSLGGRGIAVTTCPSSAVLGQLLYNNTTEKLYPTALCLGSTWKNTEFSSCELASYSCCKLCEFTIVWDS